MAKDLRESNRRDGFYWQGKTPFVSVTNILKILDKPALRYWYGKEVYQAVIVDPTISEKEALAAPYRRSKDAMALGTSVHSIAENYKKVGKNLKDMPKPLKRYAQAFYDWVDAMEPKILENERTVLSGKHKYAGTLDMLAEIGGETYVIDIKTGKAIYNEVQLQLSAYQEALKEQGIKNTKLAVLLLEKDSEGLSTGKYIWKTIEPKFEEFLSAKRLWKWVNKAKCKKYGYR